MTDKDRIKALEKALQEYVERYGLLDGARDYFIVTGESELKKQNPRPN